MKVNMYIILACAAAALGGILFGYDTAVIAGSIGYYSEYFGLSNTMVGFSVSSALIGCVIGAKVTGYFSDRFGRKKTLILSAVLFGVSAIFSAIPPNFEIFVLARILGGIGVGMASLMVPMYISEIAPAKTRGILVTFNSIAVTFGILVVYFVNYQIAAAGDTAWNVQEGWRWMFASELIPVAIFLLSLMFVPESPRWLVKKGRSEEALAILKKARSSTVEANIELQAIESSLVVEAENRKKAISLLNPALRMPLFIGITLAFIQQASGINVVFYYATEILKQFNIGEGENAAFFQSVLLGLVNFGATFIALFTVEKFGRKKLMTIGSVGIGFAMILIGINIFVGNMGTLLLVLIFAYITLFAFTFGPVVWLLIAEIFPTEVRAKAMGVCVMALWLFNIIVAQTFPMINGNEYLNEVFNGAFPFLLYGAIALVSIPFCLKFVPETKGKTLEQIQEEMETKRSFETKKVSV